MDYSVQFEEEPIFKRIVHLLTCISNFGVLTHTGHTNKKHIVEVTRKPKFQQMLRFYVGNEAISLKRETAERERQTLLLPDRSPSTITYNSGNEVVKVRCHYGAWNNDDVRQFT